MKFSKFLTTLGLTTILSVSGANIVPFTSILFQGSKAEAAVTVRNDYVWMDMPQTGNQNDNWSCGPTSAARVINFYGHNVNRDTLVDAINKDFVIPPSINVPAPTLTNPFGTRRVDIRTGTTPHALRDVMKRWEGDNVKLERKADFNKLLGLLRQGKPVVALIRNDTQSIAGTTWPTMHWIVINGFDQSKREIYFTETNDGGTYSYSYSEFQSMWDWRVGQGLASEALYKNGVEPKTMIWVDRVPPVVAQFQTPSQSGITTINPIAVSGETVFSFDNVYFSSNIPEEIDQNIGELLSKGHELKSIAFASNGGWSILYDRNGFFNRNIPDEAHQVMTKLAGEGHELKSIAFASNGGWSILYDRNGFFNRNIPDEAHQMMTKLAGEGHELKSIAFASNGGWSILYDRNGFFNRNIPDEAHQVMTKLAGEGHKLKSIAFASNGGWSILYDRNGFFNRNIPDEAHQVMTKLAGEGSELRSVGFLRGGNGWAFLAN
jgi:N6-adenosine-specific RNA methylase IME4